MRLNLFRACALAGALGAFVACSDSPTTAPRTGAVPTQKPSYNASTGFNDAGKCMADDAVAAPTGTISGIKFGDDPATASNCTSQDVKIATATLSSYLLADENGNFSGTPIPYNPGDHVTCTVGQRIQLTMAAKLNETATSARADIGVWIATDGGAATTGACNHYNLTVNPLVDGSGVTNPDNDSCGDLNAGAVVPSFDLGTFTAVCETAASATNGLLHIGSCIGWKEPGADAACPLPDAKPNTLPNWNTESPTGYRFGTLYANKSKCNCDGFDVPITVVQSAKLEVVKACTPTTDPGTFDLLIDNSTTVNAVVVGDNKACGTGTGAQKLSAGTNVAPGAVHSFGEGDFTTANYTSSYQCVNRLATGPQHVFTASGDAAATGTSLGPNQITLEPNEDVVCTYTNVRNKGKIELVKSLSPTTDPGLFNLFIKSGATTVASASNVGNNGTTGTGGTLLDIGTYNLSETAGTATALTDYTTTGPVCVNRVGGGAVSVTSGNVSLVSNADVVCTITNTRDPAKLELKKALSPTTDPGLFNLFIKSGSTTVASASNVGNNGTTGSGGTSLAPGTYNLSETAGTGTVITNYTASAAVCVNRVGGGSVTVTGGNVSLVSNADVVCTITNTRNVGKLELIKSLSPTTDPGLFNLFIKSGSTTVASASNVGNNGTTGAGGTTLNTGTYNLSETAGTATVITDYTASAAACVNRVGGGAVTVTSGNVNLVSNADVVCTITNTRNGGKLELIKALSPTTDPGLFNLFIKSGATTVASASDVGNNGTTGAGGTSLAPGTYNLSEAGGTGTVLTDYTTTGPVCVNRVGGGAVTVTSGNVNLVSNADVVCTITNTRNPGKLELKKALSPTTDPGLFNLFIKSGATTVASASGVGNNGTTGAGGTSLAPGTYNLSETAGTGTVITNYTASAPVCVNRVGGGAVTVTSGNVSLLSNADVVCTITNTRNPGKLELKKALSPTTDPGLFNLGIKSGATTVGSASNVGNGGTTGAGGTSLAPGTYNLSETAGTGTVLTEYTASAPVCVNRVGGGAVTVTSGNVSLVSNADVVCTITNTRNPPNLSITKTPDQTGDQGYSVQPPGPAVFTITVSNSNAANTGTATGVTLTDTLPAGLTWTTADNGCSTSGTVTPPLPDGDGLTHQVLFCNIGTLAPGASVTVHVSAAVPSSFVQQPPSAAGTPIDIDGDLIAGAGRDWETLSNKINCGSPKIGCDLDKPTGTTDDSFGQGTKEDSPVPSVVSGAIPNNKSDLQRFYVSNERFNTTDFLYLAWERVQAPTGTTNMDFELNQSSQKSANGVTPVRTAGDILIKYDLSKGGTQPTLGFHKWVTSGNASTVCEASNTVPCWGKGTALLNGALAAVNTGSVTDPILAPGQNGSRTLDALTFGEASINLQLTGIFPESGTSCVSFGQAYLKSRSSDSFTSEIKDFIAPIPVSVTNCVTVLLNNKAWVSVNNVSKSDTGQIQVSP
jgi:hypothetical protein